MKIPGKVHTKVPAALFDQQPSVVSSHPSLHLVPVMIPRFSDHAASERTFLASLRTAITVMAFGFMLERFDLFLAYTRCAAWASRPRPRTCVPRNGWDVPCLVSAR